MGRGNVLQYWIEDLPWKQQSVILSSLRGPDTRYCSNLKKISKWMRRITQNNADISSPYMEDETLPSIEEIEKEAEFCTVHYLSHLLHGLEIIAYKHPNKTISNIAKNYYLGFVDKILHLNPETKDQLEGRLNDVD